MCLRGPDADLSLLVEAGRVVASGSSAPSAGMIFAVVLAIISFALTQITRPQLPRMRFGFGRHRADAGGRAAMCPRTARASHGYSWKTKRVGTGHATRRSGTTSDIDLPSWLILLGISAAHRPD
jgi:hypothetical protein